MRNGQNDPDAHAGEGDLDRAARDTVQNARPDSAQIAAWQEILTRDLSPVRPLPGSAVLTALLFSVPLVVTLGSRLILADSGWQLMDETQRWAIWLTLGVSAAFLARLLASEMIPGSRAWSGSEAASSAVLAVLCAVLSLVLPNRQNPDLLGQGLRCLRTGIPVAVGMLLVLRALVGRGSVYISRGAGALLGATAGMVPVGVLELHCPNLDRWHGLLTHYSICLAAALVGWFRPNLLVPAAK